MDPTPRYLSEIKSFIHSMFSRGQIDKETKTLLIPHHPRTARLYLLLKIHKPGNPGRPIMYLTGALTEKISHFVDCFLQPHANSLPSYILYTTNLVNELRKLPPLPPGALLVTLDVTSLYINIPHNEGIRACEEFLNLLEHLVPSMADLCHFIQSIFIVNCFTFNENHYLQIHRTDMGTHMAP